MIPIIVKLKIIITSGLLYSLNRRNSSKWNNCKIIPPETNIGILTK